MTKFLPVLTGLLLTFGLDAQAPLGTWTSYLPYNDAVSLAITPKKVFCSTTGGMFYFDLSSQSVEKFSKENGLSDFDIATLGYSSAKDILVIAYTNANIDLVSGNTIINIPDVKRKQIIGDKNIYDIHFIGNSAYLACGFGIIKLDLDKKEISETYYVGEQGSKIKVSSLTDFGNHLYAATDQGLLQASLQSGNLIDFENWHQVNGIPGGIDRCTQVVSTQSMLFANMKGKTDDQDLLYAFDGQTWQLFQDYGNATVYHLSASEEKLAVCQGSFVQILDMNDNILREVWTGHSRFALFGEDNTLWIADKGKGLVRSRKNEELFSVYPDGPADLSIFSLEDFNGKLIGVDGGYTANMNNLYNNTFIYRYADHEWNNWISILYKDPVAIAFDPSDPAHYFIATWGYGLLEFKDDELAEAYDEHNSSLQTIIPNDRFIRIGGLAFDSQHNLWVPNSGVANPLSVLKNDGEWKSFPIASAVDAPNIGKMIITRDDNIWMLLPGGRGIFVYDFNGTPDNADDDRYKKLSVTDMYNKVLTNDIQAIAEDRDGNIWLGTNQGVLVYYSPWRVFEDDLFYASQIIVPRNDGSGNGDLLLGTETVTAIEVDGANRKWLGTKNGGVFLVSGDGLKQIHSFNTDNSPLLSNSITDIAIDEKTGEVFFGTYNGIISYISDATAPEEVFNDVFVFPNPVRPDYQGDIVINGLIENTYIKITDLNGNLVHEMVSRGGRAVWDGKNLLGDRVSTGIYLIFCTNEDGSQTHIAKLMFIH